MIKYAIFDLDGTLLNTITTLTYYVNNVLRKRGIKEISEDECKYFIGNGARLLIKRTLDSRGVSDENTFSEVFSEFTEAYNKDTLYLTKAYDGIPELISQLRERKIRLAVLSNKPDDATKAIIPSFFGDSFELVYGGRDGVALKPMPDGFYQICKEFSASPDEVMYLGDSDVDMYTGKNAGAKITVGVAWGFRTREELIGAGADVIVESPDQIIKLLD